VKGWQQEHFPSDPKTVYRAALKAFEAQEPGVWSFRVNTTR